MYGGFFVSAIILAAGNSSRMALDAGRSKVLLKILGKPCLWYTLKTFSKCYFIDEIVVVCKLEHMLRVRSMSEELNVIVNLAKGGNSRQGSVIKGVEVTSSSSDYLIIHDAARCLVTSDLVEDVLSDAVRFGGCSVLGVPVKDTIKAVGKGFLVDKTLERGSLYGIQTPQVIKKVLYLNGLKKAIYEKKEFTDDSQIVENYTNSKVHITLGDYNNIKITTREDLVFAKNVLENRSKEFFN